MTNRSQPNGFVTLTITLIIIIIVIFASLLTGRLLTGNQRIAANELRYREAFAVTEGGVEALLGAWNAASGSTPTLCQGVASGVSSAIRTGNCYWAAFVDMSTSSAQASNNDPQSRTPICVPPTATSAAIYTLRTTGFTVPAATACPTTISTIKTAIAQSEANIELQIKAIKVKVLAGAPDAPITVAGGLGVNGNFTVVANPNGGGRGVPLSVWTDLNVDLDSGSGQTCGQQEWDPSAKACTSANYSSKNNKLSDILDNDPNFPDDLLEYVFGLPSDTPSNTAKSMAELERRATRIPGEPVPLPNCNSLGSNSYGLYVVDGDCNPAGTIGSRTSPVILLLRDGDLTMNGNMTIYGLVFSYDSYPTTAPDYNIKMTGGATIYGAVVANHKVGNSAGTYNAVYDAATLQNIEAGSPFNYVTNIPGSWKDW